MSEMRMPQRIEILSEEEGWAANTQNYYLKMKQVKDFAPTGRQGHMGAIYFMIEGQRPDFKANTDMYPKRDEALDEGKGLINKYQQELDDSVAKARAISDN